MRIRGKIIGGLLGLLIGGPIGLLFGVLLGHWIDLGYLRAFIAATQAGVHTHAQKVFFDNTFKIMGYIAKSDGHVSESEIHAAREVMSKMGLNEVLKQQAITLFSFGKQKDFNVDHALFELRQVFRLQPTLLQLFLDIQLQMARADGGLTTAKQSTLQYICDKLGVANYRFDESRQQQWRYQHQQYQHPRATETLSLQEAYDLLNVSKEATHDEIKKAYRRAMSQNHPDKLIAKGLPPEMIKVATQKTQKIKKAFDVIRKNSGF